ncbi:hypothetical protein GCM10010449_36560 [Streptomyces rectiviolaceus]|uniref:Uncharacterized protein n=1 Tax=Streptomyces rectiviolaceus TaxID=332591 RepID=A0ABP6MFZ9_9ACTN
MRAETRRSVGELEALITPSFQTRNTPGTQVSVFAGTPPELILFDGGP